MYLTADSPETITQLEKGKVYILGGLVDRNAHKGLCFRKATVKRHFTQNVPYITLAKLIKGYHSLVVGETVSAHDICSLDAWSLALNSRHNEVVGIFACGFPPHESTV